MTEFNRVNIRENTRNKSNKTNRKKKYDAWHRLEYFYRYHIAAKCIIDNDFCFERTAGMCIYVYIHYYIYLTTLYISTNIYMYVYNKYSNLIWIWI